MDISSVEAMRLGSQMPGSATGQVAAFYVADRRYLPLALASAASAAERMTSDLPVVLLLVDVPAGIARAACHFLSDRGLSAEARPLDLSGGATDLARLPTMRDSISPATYGRLIGPHVLAEFETVIYLDGDTLIDGDLAELALIRPQTLAATVSAKGLDRKLYTENLIEPAERYFNAGVCVINGALWRDEDITDRALKLAADDRLKLSMHDQDVMNLIFGHRFFELHPRWNFTKGASWTYPGMTPAIAHFAGRIYPWDRRDRRCPQVYRDRYAALFAAMPAEITESLPTLMMPEIEVRRAKAWWPMAERLGWRRRSGWNPDHAAMLRGSS